MSPRQSTSRRRVLTALAILTAAVLATSLMLWPRLRPLNASERRLVGQWIRPGDTNSQVSTFAANRRFSADCQFVGSWSIADGRLHIRFWSKDPPRWYRRLTPDKDEVLTEIKFNNASDRIELGLPANPEPVILHRKTKP
jgi:hypothetical protein